jgi:hypothetical protein
MALSTSVKEQAMNATMAAQTQPPHREFSLDAHAYRTLAFAKLEDAAVWTREWICIGIDRDIPGAGDLLPFTAGDHAVHVQRLADGRLAGRFNLAQHGGCRVVPLQCRQGAKTSCSFTSCGHSRDRLPLPAEAADKPSAEMYQYLGLRPERLLGVRVATHGPLVFVHLDPSGESFDPVRAQLDAVLPGFTNDGTYGSHASEWIEFAGNWKRVGQRITNGLSQAETTAHCASFACVGDSLRAVWCFPNLILLTDACSACVVVLQPVALERTLCRISVFDSRTASEWRDILAHRCEPQDFVTTDSTRWFEAALAACITARTRQPVFSGYDET